MLGRKGRCFVSAFRGVHGPVSLVGAPLKTICRKSYPRSVGGRLTITLRRVNKLRRRLVTLVRLGQLFNGSNDLMITRRRVNTFVEGGISFLRSRITKLRVGLSLIPSFSCTDT